MLQTLLDKYKDNPEALEVIRLINHTKDSIFLTGKAGTGKSTLLKNITSNLKKNFIIIAPTGIAAINVGGQTINSFFRIALRPYLPEDEDIASLESKQDILKNLNLIVIDEVSMVRADLMNAIDLSLRKNLNSSEPFAGIQLLMIGDLFQLPPVINSQNANEVEILTKNYQTPYFFSTKAFEKGLKYHIIELQKVYRQNDKNFINLLNAVRENTVTNQDLININERFNPIYEPSPDSDEITLATTNQIVGDINSSKLSSIQSVPYEFIALTTGTFENDISRSRLPTNKILILKKNAQIMFIKNDTGENRRWVNGTLGKVISIESSEISILIASTNSIYKVERVTWEDIEYIWNKKEGKIEQKVVGTFTQFPLKLAWAVTIHKSQGQTFDKTIINLGSGAFTTGQTYVALSRCRTFQGITLKTKVRISDIKVDERVQFFLDSRQVPELETKKYNSIISGIESTLTKCSTDNQSLIEERQTLINNVDILSKQIQNLKLELSTKNKTISDLSVTNQKSKDEIISLKQELIKVDAYKALISDKENKLKSKEYEIRNLQTHIEDLKSKKKNPLILRILILALICIIGFLYYKQLYLPEVNVRYISQTNKAFSYYLESSPIKGCKKENIGARTVLIDDLNNDGKLDGIIIAVFDGVDCKNSFETVLYVYNLEDKFTNPPLELTLSKKNRSIVSFRGIENGKVVFDKWNLKDYDQKKYNTNKIANSHLRMYIDIQNNKLNLNINKY